MPADSGDERVRHEPEARRFTQSSGGALAVLEYRETAPRTVEYHHTYVPPALRGRGIASRLASYALRHALDNGLTVVATCPFVAAFIRKHPEYTAVLGR
jgi:predicted GNAT family acetyltransferase